MTGAPILRRVVLAAAGVIVGPGIVVTGAEVLDRLVAVVNGRPILLSDVRAAPAFGLIDVADGQGPEAALARMIERTLVLEEVDRYGPSEPAAARVAQRVDAVRARLGPAAFAAALARSGLDEAALGGLARDQLRMDDYLAQRFGAAAQPTDEEVQRYYLERAGEFVREGRELSFREAEPIARERLAAMRRAGLISDWIAGLRRRGDVRVIEPQ
jgi:parvulin-like peptidyl-prolyl isomerase